MIQPAYNMQQRIYALNILSNLASMKIGSQDELQEDLYKLILMTFNDPKMISLIGKWELEWGPVVSVQGADKKIKVSSNAMFMASYVPPTDSKLKSKKQYVIAVAGTNGISPYGWMVEDFQTMKMSPWFADNDAPDAPRIAVGTKIGIDTLFSMKWNPAPEAPEAKKVKNLLKLLPGKKDSKETETQADGISLVEYLRMTFNTAESSVNTSLTVTGHSLGGTLSAPTALKLLETQKDWNPNLLVNITAMPTAGASPGNLAFSDYYGEQLGQNTIRYWNVMDPVPYGHQPDMLRMMPHIYYPYIVPQKAVYILADLLLASSLAGTYTYRKEGGNYTQLMPQNAPLRGQFNAMFPSVSPMVMVELLIDVCLLEILPLFGFTKSEIDTIIKVLKLIFATVQYVGKVMDFYQQVIKHKEFTLKDEKKNGILASILALFDKHAGDALQFLQQLSYQHVWAYTDLLNMKAFQKQLNALRKQPTPDEYLELMIKDSKETMGKVLTTCIKNSLEEENL